MHGSTCCFPVFFVLLLLLLLVATSVVVAAAIRITFTPVRLPAARPGPCCRAGLCLCLCLCLCLGPSLLILWFKLQDLLTAQ
jgi:hypothetical protein